MTESVLIRDKKVGPGNKAYIIAEAGANHNGDMGLARELIDAAVDCGCDAVKFQLWEPTVWYTASHMKANPAVREELEKYQCTRDQHAMLKAHADSRGIHFASTAVTESDTDFLVDLGVDFMKIASMDTDNPLYIRYVAEKNLPTILSTGLATWSEATTAVDCFRPEFIQNLVVLHCVALYPPPDETVNLAKMSTMREVLDVPVGFSDHTVGTEIPIAAISRGAVAIEKHFTLDKEMPGWDHTVSANPEEMRAICTAAKRIHAAIGEPNPDVSDAEKEKAVNFRRSIVTKRALKSGQRIKAEDLQLKRPATGIHPFEIPYVVGRTATRDVGVDEILKWDDVG